MKKKHAQDIRAVIGDLRAAADDWQAEAGRDDGPARQAWLDVSADLRRFGDDLDLILTAAGRGEAQ